MPIVNYEKEYKIFRVLIAIGRLLHSLQLVAFKETSVQADKLGFGKYRVL